MAAIHSNICPFPLSHSFATYSSISHNDIVTVNCGQLPYSDVPMMCTGVTWTPPTVQSLSPDFLVRCDFWVNFMCVMTGEGSAWHWWICWWNSDGEGISILYPFTPVFIWKSLSHIWPFWDTCCSMKPSLPATPHLHPDYALPSLWAYSPLNPAHCSTFHVVLWSLV